MEKPLIFLMKGLYVQNDQIETGNGEWSMEHGTPKADLMMV